ncbi:partner of Y14 and mago [Stigmatopora argus]
MATPYVTDESGKYIAATQRPDGTWRKPRRVKQGYVPQEEVPVYENKYVKFFKNKPGLPPGLSASDAEPAKQQQQKGCSDGDAAGLSKSAKRNMKRKEKRKQQQEELEESPADVATLADAVENVSISASGEVAEDSSSLEKAKKIKNMKKKLRQVDELQQKVDSGEIKQLTQEQLEKLARAKTLRDELQQLERLS